MTLEKAIEWREHYLHQIGLALRAGDMEALQTYAKKARLLGSVIEIETALREAQNEQ